MEIQDLQALTDIGERIAKLKERATKLPDATALLKDWDETKHDVMSEEIRKKRKTLIEEGIFSPDGKVIKAPRYEDKEVNRIALPIEQDVVNIQTAFTFGTEPKLTCDTEDKEQKDVFEFLKSILRRNKMKYLNKKIMRAWLAETEVAEYWYKDKDASWWKKVLSFLKIKNDAPDSKLRCAIWSPFNGDLLFPVFNALGDMIAFCREYKVKEGTEEVTKFMEINDTEVIIYKQKGGSWEETPDKKKHGFVKMPVIYMWREKPYCDKIKTIRNRLETLLSNYADCLDYNFFPKLVADGLVENITNRGTGSEIIQLANNAKIKYLTWEQAPDMAKLEFDNLTERCYSLVNTPRISFESLAGKGDALAGVAFKFAFMGAHMAVYNHAEVVEEYLQRRVNFLVSAIGSIYPKYKTAAEEIDVETEIVPYMITNKKDDVELATTAVEGGVASVKQGIILAGLTTDIDGELKAIEGDKASKTPIK